MAIRKISSKEPKETSTQVNPDGSVTTTTKTGGYTKSSTRAAPNYRYGTPIAENDMGGGVSSTIFSDTTRSAGSSAEARQMAEAEASGFYGRQTTGGYAPFPQVAGGEMGQPQQLLQGEKKKAGTLAKIGVTPAVITANILSKTLNLLSGGKLDLGTTSPEEIASTDVGKFLGLATLGAGAVAGGVGIAGAAGGTAGITGAASSVAGKITVPNAIKGLLIKNGVVMKALSSTTGKLIVGGSVVGLPVKLQNDAKQAVTSSRSALSLTTEAMKVGELSYGEANVAISEIENQINSYERSMKLWSKLSVINWLGGGKDNLVDVQNAKRDVLITKQNLNQQVVNQQMVR